MAKLSRAQLNSIAQEVIDRFIGSDEMSDVTAQILSNFVSSESQYHKEYEKVMSIIVKKAKAKV